MKKVHKKIIKTREKHFSKALQIILLVLMVIWDYQAWSYLLSPTTIYIDNTYAEMVSTQSEEIAVSPVSISSDEGQQAPLADISEMIKQAFPECPDTMLAIAKTESGLNPLAHNENSNGTIDTGLFQINSVHGYDQKWLEDPENNISAARKVFEKQGLKAWVTFSQGYYKGNL